MQSIEGITAIAFGGSRARANHTNKSDVDLGIDYNPENKETFTLATVFLLLHEQYDYHHLQDADECIKECWDF